MRVKPATWFALAALALIPVAARRAAADETPRLELRKGDRVILIGNTLAERMQHFGHFETLLHSRFPDRELVVRNLGWSADELTLRPRSQGFEAHGHTLKDETPDVVIAAFGFNESFAGPAGLVSFKKDLEQFIRETTSTKYNGTAAPRLVLLSPIAHEDLGDLHRPDGKKNNANIQLYTDTMAELAKQHGAVFIDLFAPSWKMMEEDPRPLTINGIHLGDYGYQRLAPVLDEALFGPRPATITADLKRLYAEVQEKNLQSWYDYRAINGCYIYGGRQSPFGVVNFPAEFAKLRQMVAVRDRRIWAVARGEAVPDRIDDKDTGALTRVESNVKGPVQLTSPEETRNTFTLPEGYEANLFASEVEFPDLRKPCQMTFDARGRLWVTTMASYPMYLPGRPVDDKVLILEDTDGDGRADKQTVFADKLHVPTGIELGDGGAYVAQQPNLMFLKDTDGDDRADTRDILLHGFDTADSHHALHAFTWDPGGALYWQEGTFHHTQVETPYGPQRLKEAGVFRFEPRSLKFEVFVSYPFANPWGHYVDRWGQNFVADASNGFNYFGTAFSGQVDYPDKHGRMEQILQKQWRPSSGCELVSSRNFPDDTQGDYLLNNVIGFQGVLRYRVKEDGSGFKASPVEPLLSSSDPNFRPVDLEFGPDGALYLVDWYNPLVGHMQHSLRDPNRDVEHGRIWRISYTKRPLVAPAEIAGATVPELLERLKAYEDRTRYRTRRELREHPAVAVMAALDKWIAGLSQGDPDYWHHRLEALWLRQSFDVIDEGLLRQLLSCPEPRARAAATRVLCSWRDRVTSPLELFRTQVNDAHPRVRLEAVRAMSFFGGDAAATAQEIALESLGHPQDVYLQYTLAETNKTLDRRLRALGRSPSRESPLVRLLISGPKDRQETVVEMIGKRGTASELAALYQQAVRPGGLSDASRRRALDALADAALTRRVRPEGDRSGLGRLIQPDERDPDAAVRLAAIRLAGLWKVEALNGDLQAIALSSEASGRLRSTSLEALAAIGGPAGRASIEKLLAADRPWSVRAQAVASLARLDVDAAAERAAAVLHDAVAGQDLAPLLAAFLNIQGGPEKLAAAVVRHGLPADAAKLALRGLYALGRSDPALVAELNRAAGLNAEPKPPSPQELQQLVADVMSQGDPARGEALFRRADLNCMKCHAVSGAGGDIGPDLSAVGSTSPPDYLIHSVLLPDQAIKEDFQTLVVLTLDGQVYQGIVADRDNDRVVLKEATGERRVIPTAAIEDQKPGGSLMPKGQTNITTRGEFLDLIRFLSELGKPGPYAIRSSPTIQRWRVLTPVPAGLAQSAPDSEAFRAQILGAAEGSWVPAYSQVAGALPLDELTAATHSPVLYVQGEVNVTAAGPVTFRLDSPIGIQAWIDEQQIAAGDTFTTDLASGRHTLTLRIDTARRATRQVRVELSRADGSPAEFTAVGGR